MLSIPSIYQPADRDVVVGLVPLRRTFRTRVDLAGVTVVAVTPVVPQDQVFILHGATAQAIPGAAQNIVSGIIHMVDGQALVQLAQLDVIPNALAVNLTAFLRWDGAVIPVMGGELIAASVTFNAGVALNSVVLSVWGVIIPRGNWQFG